MNKPEVMNSLLAQTAKKAEGKKRNAPTTPKEKKGRVKKHSRGFSKKPSFACGRGRIARALDAELDAAAAAFRGTAEDRRLWAAIAWRVGVAEFHYAVADKMREDAADGQPRHPAAAFQAFLNRRFPKSEAAGVPLPRKPASHRGSGALAASSATRGGAA